MKNAPQYNPELVGADTRLILETELLSCSSIGRGGQLN